MMVMKKKMEQIDKRYLSSTPIIDSDHKKIIEYANDTVSEAGNDPAAKATRLFYAVRDSIWYTVTVEFFLPEHFRASNVLESGHGHCVRKASLLCALGRACGIPSRLGFATVRNHLANKQLIEFLGCDLFVYHGFTEFYLGGKWVKATPTFNIELCKKQNVAPLEFNGREDSLFQVFNLEKKQFMEYVTYHGSYSDVPIEAILTEWKKVYGKSRVEEWIQQCFDPETKSKIIFGGIRSV
jgi:transglutaminase-like putative cysteine protease